MSVKENLYCKIYVDADVNIDQLFASISEIMSGSVNFWTIITKFCEIDIKENEDFDSVKRNLQDGFVHFPFYLDIEPRFNITRSDYINSVAKLLKGIWQLNYNAVASCDFEDELPQLIENQNT